jgi:hypothetical protein
MPEVSLDMQHRLLSNLQMLGLAAVLALGACVSCVHHLLRYGD